MGQCLCVFCAVPCFAAGSASSLAAWQLCPSMQMLTLSGAVLTVIGLGLLLGLLVLCDGWSTSGPCWSTHHNLGSELGIFAAAALGFGLPMLVAGVTLPDPRAPRRYAANEV